MTTLKDIDCVVCNMPLIETGAIRGMGNGTEQKFAHDECCWRQQSKELSQELSLLKQEIQTYIPKQFLTSMWGTKMPLTNAVKALSDAYNNLYDKFEQKIK